MVVAAQPLATAAGLRMLELGGNAADAAVAAAFAISVTEPSMNSIGGRTQVLVRTPDGRFFGIDATTQAPDSYDPDAAPQASYGYSTIGVPGTVAGLARLLREHGTLPLAAVIAPAIDYAERGFHLLPGEARRQGQGARQAGEFEGTRRSFMKADGSTYGAGELFVQEDLARTLRAIAGGGENEFYRGSIAQRIAADMEAQGGAVTLEALGDYRALDARIVRGSYRGYELVGTFTPASGATTIEILQILESFDLATLEPAEWAAVVGQAIALGFADRRQIREPGDLDWVLSRDWAAERAREIRLASVDPVGVGAANEGEASLDWLSGLQGWGDSGHTTHLSTADADGMVVALTQTIGPNMGSKVATPGLGFLYAATLGGYLGRLEPGERAGSSISPMLVMRDGQPVLVLGAAGGARIVSAVVQAVARVIDQGMSLAEALEAPRVHPTSTGIEMETSPGTGWTPGQVRDVQGMGLDVTEQPRVGAFGRVHGIYFDAARREWVGAADPDWEGSAGAPSPASTN
jgi:gamma-glutamyltranspeptidase/glutathione hydrolase